MQLDDLYITDGARDITILSNTYKAVANGFLTDVDTLPELYFLSNITSSLTFRINFADEASATTIGSKTLGDTVAIYRLERDPETFAPGTPVLLFAGIVTGKLERSGVNETTVEYKIGTNFATDSSAYGRDITDFAVPAINLENVNWG